MVLARRSEASVAGLGRNRALSVEANSVNPSPTARAACDHHCVIVKPDLGTDHRVRRRGRLGVAAAAVLLVVLGGGCTTPAPTASDLPDAALTAALDEVPVVALRGPDNPTLDPEVLAEFWDSARVRSATPPPASPLRGSAGLAGPPPAAADPPVAVPAERGAPFAQALLVRGPIGSALVAGRGPSANALLPAGVEVADAPVLSARLPAALAGRATGRLFFTVGGQPRSCTASVVTSGNRSVVITAGHCLIAAEPETGGARLTATNFLFGPGYVDGTFPFGRWTVQSVHVAQGWSQRTDWSEDVAFLRMAPSAASGDPVQAAVGALGVVFDVGGAAARPGVSTALLGYPSVAPFDGSTLRWCATTSPTPAPPVALHGFGLRCAMTAGYSGGPAVAEFDPDTGTGYVVGVGSHDYAAGTVYSASLGSGALAAYTEADR